VLAQACYSRMAELKLKLRIHVAMCFCPPASPELTWSCCGLLALMASDQSTAHGLRRGRLPRSDVFTMLVKVSPQQQKISQP